jgi:hypothetical protein
VGVGALVAADCVEAVFSAASASRRSWVSSWSARRNARFRVEGPCVVVGCGGGSTWVGDCGPLVSAGWVGGVPVRAGWVGCLGILGRLAMGLLFRLTVLPLLAGGVPPSGEEGRGWLVGGVFGEVVPGRGSSAASPLQGVRRLLGGGALPGSSGLLTEGPRALPFAFFPSPFSITVSGSSATELVWFEVPVDFRPAVGLVVRLGWRTDIVPLSVEPIVVELVLPESVVMRGGSWGGV